MKILHVNIANKIATYQKRDGDIVCGNSDYQIQFTFDSEWDAYEEKTARFIWNGHFIDVDFTGDTCDVPIVQNTDKVKIGVYAGQLSTTTSASIGCKPSILCEGAGPSEENDHYYANEAKEAAERAEEAAERAEEAAERAEEAGGGGPSDVTVVQTTGDSETAVMSQKAVTTELNKKISATIDGEILVLSI